MEFLKKNKSYVVVATVVGVLAMIVGVGLLADAKEANAIEDAQADTSVQVTGVVEDVKALYADESKTMLAEGVTVEQVVALEEEIAVLLEDEFLTDESKSELELASTELGYVKQMIELRDLATALFNEDGTIKEGADIEAVQIKADSLKEFKPEYVATIQVQIDDANAQVAAIAKAEEEAKKQAEQYASADDSTSSSSSSSSNDSGTSSSSSSSSSNDSETNYDDSDNWEDEEWSAELTVDYYYIIDGFYNDGEGGPTQEFPEDVYQMTWETEDEMHEYMNSNFTNCSYSFGIAYEEVSIPN